MSAKKPGILELSREQIADRLRREMAKAGGTVVKFIKMMESFRGEIPDEGKRVSAALKAMEHAADLDKDDILASAEQQRTTLKKQQKLFAQALDEKRDEMSNSARRAKELKARIEDLNDEVRQLNDEYEQAKSEATDGESMIKKAEQRMDEAARMLDDEMVAFKDKLNHKNLKSAPSAPSDEKMETLVSSLDFDVAETQEPDEASADQKPCPQCGGELAWYELYEKWGCYSCGYQEE
ncbi:MAG: hypothetical protein KAR83_00575 [Thermodesulfovibrionales bacterium]|nr:hypothetical protein [Thermodesulfovibrionales bacterium]